jgi:hypothetical protein
MEDDVIYGTPAQEYTFAAVEFNCPVHGNVGQHFFTSTIPGHEGVFCLKCMVEKLEVLGVSRVTRI